MQLPQLLKQYKLTAQQLTALLSRHLTVPNLRLVREVPAGWEDLLRRELGLPPASLLPAVEPAVAPLDAGAGLVAEAPAVALTATKTQTPAQVTGNDAVNKPAHPAAKRPAKHYELTPIKPVWEKPPAGRQQPGAEAWKLGRLVEVIEGRYGRLRPAGSTERLHLPGPAIGHEFPPKDSWLLFIDRPNKKNPALTDIHRAMPLGQAAPPQLRAVLAAAADPVLSVLLTSEVADEVRRAVAAELLARLVPVADEEVLSVTVRTLDLEPVMNLWRAGRA